MKDIRIFIASSKELERERNYLAFLVLAKEDEFAARGLRVRLAKWEYVDPKMTEVRTEDRYLDEMYNCDAALVLFRDIAGMYTREELDKALAREREGSARLKTHQVLFAADGKADSDAEKLRESLPLGSYGVWSDAKELSTAFLSLVDKVAQSEWLVDALSDKYVRKITAFLAADEELAEERNAFADTVLNVNDLLEQAHRNIRVQLKFYDSANAESVIESSEMGLALYGTNYRMFGSEEIKRIYERVKDGTQNPKRFYVFFRNLDEAEEKSLDEAFKTFRSDFVSKLGHFTCQFGDANALRLGFLLSLERYAGESIEIYSTVSAPTTSVFVGRENELRRLCELLEPVPGRFPAGRLPVITGAGGTGKSELVRQYASQRRVQYPGGVFQVDMEHVKTWDEAFLGILKGTPNNGVKVEEYLGLKVEGDADKERSKEPVTGAEVRDALLRLARESGPVLLVLDNVEGCMPLIGRDGGFRKAFPAGFSERVRVNVVATARVCDVILRDTDWAVPFPLGDLSQDAALEVLLADCPDADAAERKAASRVAELIGCRALYLRRVPALIGDLYAQTVCDSYAELAKALEENLLETVAEETEGTHLPDVLWKMTRERLVKMPFGTECVKLAQVASFFSSEGFPQHILKHLWKTVVAPNLDEKKFERAFAILRHHNVFQSEAPVRIHRLDRAAILQCMEADSGLQEEIGLALATYERMPLHGWLALAEWSRISRHVPEKVWRSHTRNKVSLLCDMLLRNDKLSVHVDLGQLSGGDWAALICKRPSFSASCSWEKLNGNDWSRLLQERPELADFCDWNKLWCINWVELLIKQPQFAEGCPWTRMCQHRELDMVALYNRWVDQLVEFDWARLIAARPEFAEYCPFDRFMGRDWAYLLARQPRFSNQCTWKKLDELDWAMLVCDNWTFSERCPWNAIGGKGWGLIVARYPHLFDRCPWGSLSGSDWSTVLRQQPQFSGKCPWEKLLGDDWALLLVAQPQFADKCPWAKMTGWNVSRLLKARPEFADRVDWVSLFARPECNDIAVWTDLLSERPEFAGKCPWERIFCGTDDPFEWDDAVEFLDKCPELGTNVPWRLIDSGFAVRLLSHHPEFIDRCKLDDFTKEDWHELLAAQPQLSRYKK